MKKITLLNIPNNYSSFYLTGLNEVAQLKYEPNDEFKKWNGLPFIIFRSEGKLLVIDNANPIEIRQDLYEEVSCYFSTNKLKGRDDYNQPKVQPLFPHYPINGWCLYLKIFGIHWSEQIGIIAALKDLYVQSRRPAYRIHKMKNSFSSYIFFAGSIWKNEHWANEMRSEFIIACRNIQEIKFEGGLNPRSDGNNYGMDDVLSPRKYSVREFSKKSSCSLISFNNPAVRGAISWRVAECFNAGTFILSLPWHIDLPTYPIHGDEIHIIKDSNEVEDFIRFLIKNPEYHQKVALGGKAYFHKNCEPGIQARELLKRSDSFCN